MSGRNEEMSMVYYIDGTAAVAEPSDRSVLRVIESTHPRKRTLTVDEAMTSLRGYRLTTNAHDHWFCIIGGFVAVAALCFFSFATFF